MLEDCTVSMEKKVSGRSIQPQGKSAGTESKKNQDVVGCKPGSRSRRREPAGPNPSSSKQETARKSAGPKYKSLDKRPRPRGQYYSGGKEDTKVVTEENAEYGSVFTPGSKKQSLNHLLNFHYAPRGLTSQGANSVPVWSRSQRWLSNTHKHKYNKEHFLQANCQFVVRSSGDYSAYLSNPDALVDWDLVEQIRVQSGETLSCPICLSPPVAAKMTRCGHVYCWPCILHYLALSDKTWRSCPICYEAIHINGLKSVVAIQQNSLAVGDNVTMLLMCRERGSLVATPIDQYEYRLANPMLSVSETAVDTIYSKLLSAKPEEVIAILANERLQLETQLREEQGSPELCFTEQALELLGQRLALLQQNTSELSVAAEPEQAMPIQSMPIPDKYALVYDSAFDDSVVHDTTQDVEGQSGHEEQARDHGDLEEMAISMEYQQQVPGRYRCESGSSADAVTVDDLEIHHAQAAPQKQFFFYQARDGQHMYLHAMNVRMLEMQFGSLAACPRSISGRIVEKEAGSMNEELRKRLRYLQHLSITCQFEVAELDLRPPTVTKEITHHFQDQLEVRRRRRQSRAKQERRREKQITEVENRLLGRHPTPNVHIQSTRHFPQWGSEVSATSGSAPLSPVMSSLASSPRELNSPITAAMEALDIHPQHDQGPSFAQMLREGKSNPEVRKSVVQAADLEDYDAAHSLGQSFSDAIAMALEKVEQEQALGEAGLVSGKKKKKNKKKILFATSMVCSGK